MRTSAHVLLPGTANIAKFKGISEDERNLILKAIQEIEEKGIGERVQEGFGQVELMPIVTTESIDTTDVSDETLSTIDLDFKEKILNKALKFSDKLEKECKVENKIPIVQWQALLNLSNPRFELLNTEYDEEEKKYKGYLERRLKSNAKHSWKNKLKNSEQSIESALREEIKEIERFGDSEEMKDMAVKLFIEYLVREKVRLKFESRRRKDDDNDSSKR